MRPKLVKECNSIARSCGADFDNLSFVTGSIESEIGTEIPTSETSDIIISLHACDTATDDSIWYGISQDAKVIVAAPCCHQELRRFVDPQVYYLQKQDHPLSEILRHNIYKERMSEIVTDTLRGILLEIYDYDVNVFEFIGGEHTAKNIMLTAIKRMNPRSADEKKQLRHRLKGLAELYGIPRQKLADWLKEDIHSEPKTPKKSVKSQKLRTMPSI